MAEDKPVDRWGLAQELKKHSTWNFTDYDQDQIVCSCGNKILLVGGGLRFSGQDAHSSHIAAITYDYLGISELGL